MPDKVRVGFSASTGMHATLEILSWSFTSNLDVTDDIGSDSTDPNGKREGKIRLEIGLGVGLGILICGISLGVLLFKIWRKRVGKETKAEEHDISLGGEFEGASTGPKRFTYRELGLATNNFFGGKEAWGGRFWKCLQGLVNPIQHRSSG